MALLGVGNAFIWAPLSATATRNLPMQQAGAGAGVYNTTRQVGAVLGSAAIAVLMDARLAANGLGATGGEPARPPASCRPAGRGVQRAMSQSLLLAPAVLALGLVAALFFERPRHFAPQARGSARERGRRLGAARARPARL